MKIGAKHWSRGSIYKEKIEDLRKSIMKLSVKLTLEIL